MIKSCGLFANSRLGWHVSLEVVEALLRLNSVIQPFTNKEMTRGERWRLSISSILSLQCLTKSPWELGSINYVASQVGMESWGELGKVKQTRDFPSQNRQKINEIMINDNNDNMIDDSSATLNDSSLFFQSLFLHQFDSLIAKTWRSVGPPKIPWIIWIRKLPFPMLHRSSHSTFFIVKGRGPFQGTPVVHGLPGMAKQTQGPWSRHGAVVGGDCLRGEATGTRSS